MGRGHKVQGAVTDYHRWVIRKLIDRVAPDQARVVAFIIQRWIDEDPNGMLKRYGLTYEAYESATGAEVSEAATAPEKNGGAQVLQYKPRTAGGSR